MDTSKELRRCIYINDAYKGFKNWIYSDNISVYYNYERDMQSYIEIKNRDEISEILDEQEQKKLILKKK